MGRFMSSHFWGVVSDRYGRLLVAVFGLVSTVAMSVAFGMSRTFASAFLFRFLLGLLSAITVACKTLVSEVCGKEHETVGMGAVTIAWSLGAILGPGMGGILAEPATHYPGTFSEDGIFGRYPYLLPNVVGALLALVALPLVLLFIKDTEHAGRAENSSNARCLSFFGCSKDANNGENHGHNGEGIETGPVSATKTVSPLPSETFGVRKPSWMQVETDPSFAETKGPGKGAGKLLGGDECEIKQESLLARGEIRALLFIDVVYSFTVSGFNVVFTLWSLTTLAKGGLDWSTLQIGKVFLIAGCILLVFEMFAVPNLLPWLGVRLSQRLGSVIQVPVLVIFPLLSLVNTAGYSVTTATTILLFTCYACSNSVYVGISLALNNATGPDRRGELNGISMAIGSLTKAVSPVICSALYAFSIEGDYRFPFDYHLVFLMLAFVRLLVSWMGWNRLNGVERVDERAVILTR